MLSIRASLLVMVFVSTLVNALLSTSAIAEPIVIRDYGGRASGVPDKKRLAESVMRSPIQPVKKAEFPTFPLMSTLRPGVLAKPQKLAKTTQHSSPFFIVGNDELSRDWIEANKAYLTKIKASGFVTNIASDSEFQSLAAFAEPLTLKAIPVDELAEALSIRIYPVLITHEEIAQ